MVQAMHATITVFYSLFQETNLRSSYLQGSTFLMSKRNFPYISDRIFGVRKMKPFYVFFSLVFFGWRSSLTFLSFNEPQLFCLFLHWREENGS